jgi:4-hydroxybenzoate polyprenyltransferase
MGTYQRNSGPSGRVYHRSAKPRKSVARTFGESADYSDHQGCEALYTNKIVDLMKCLRPSQWVKNLLLLAAPFFAFFDQSQADSAFIQTLKSTPLEIAITLGCALVAFILISAATYVINDLHDLRGDKSHPLKRHRPIVARKVSFGAAIPLAIACLGGGFALAIWLGAQQGSLNFLYICLGYSGLQLIYTFVAKRIPDLGVILLALGFLLRAAAGAVVMQVSLSSWLMLCVFVGALFVALCKRRSAYFIKGQPIPSTNEPRILDFEIGIAASVTVACYALYTLAPKTVAHFGTENLIYTVPLVLLGVFRYVRLTYQEHRAGTPENIFLRDPLLILSGIAWVIACGVILAIAA